MKTKPNSPFTFAENALMYVSLVALWTWALLGMFDLVIGFSP